MPEPSFHSSQAQSFREIEFSPLRRSLEDHLNAAPKSFGFCALVSCDLDQFDRHVQRCHAARRRPPSLYAYTARCLGATLAAQPELLASRLKGQLLIPSRIDAAITVEMSTHDGAKMPTVLLIEDVGNRSLHDIAEEMKVRIRTTKRTIMTAPPSSRKFVPAWSPQWWRRTVGWMRSSRPSSQRRRAQETSCVYLSSTSQWMQGHGGWGVRLYTPTPLGVTLGGVSKRAVVVGDQIVAHLCVDVVLSFDHLITDGAPATRFTAALCQEIESGRLLEEYPVSTRCPEATGDDDSDDDSLATTHDAPQRSDQMTA